MKDFILQPANLVMIQTVVRLFLLSVIGFLAVRFRLLPAKSIECLSRFVIAIALPCLIISNLAANLDYKLLPEMGLCVVAAIFLNGFGLLLALLVRRFFIPPDRPGRGMFLSLAAIQNSGYLPIPLAMAILPEESRAQGLLFIFIYLLVMGLIFWTLGIRLITGSTPKKGGWLTGLRQAVNPPLVAILLGFLFLLPPVKNGFEWLSLVRDGLATVGNTTVPLVLIILGGAFSAISPVRSGRLIVNLAASLKLLIVPSLALAAALVLDLEPVFAFILILQAAMPAALNHIVVAQEYGGDVALTSQALFVQYPMSLVTVPGFLLICNQLFLVG